MFHHPNVQEISIELIMTVNKLMSIVKLGRTIKENAYNVNPILKITMASVLLLINVKLDNGKMEINNAKMSLLYVGTLILQQENA